jgi:hypothetical protein
MSEKPILIIHPKDKTTNFLGRIKNQLTLKFNDSVHLFNIYPTDSSHIQCLERIYAHPGNGIIIFLGHGRSDRLCGSRGDLFHSIDFISPAAIAENPESYYYNENFIDKNNASVFADKKVFCLACNSNEKIANYAIEGGAKSFFGFGDIPTSIAEFMNLNASVSNDVVAKMKTEINYIIKTSLVLGITHGYTFQEILNRIQFITTQRIMDISINQRHYREWDILTEHLYSFKKGATIFGEKRLKILE